MSLKIESVSITPNPVNVGEQFVISAKVSLTTWGWVKQFTWKAIKSFTWKQAKDGNVK